MVAPSTPGSQPLLFGFEVLDMGKAVGGGGGSGTLFGPAPIMTSSRSCFVGGFLLKSTT